MLITVDLLKLIILGLLVLLVIGLKVESWMYARRRRRAETESKDHA